MFIPALAPVTLGLGCVEIVGQFFHTNQDLPDKFIDFRIVIISNSTSEKLPYPTHKRLSWNAIFQVDSGIAQATDSRSRVL